MGVVGLLKLTQSLYCQYEVLGKTIHTKISGIDIEISFPKYNSNFYSADDLHYVGMNNPLLPPNMIESWKLGKEELEWGYICSYPSKDAVVSQLVLSAECNDCGEADVVQSLYRASNNWESSFIQYCILSSKQVFGESNHVSGSRVLYLWNENGHIPTTESFMTIHFNFPSREICLTLHQIEKAIEFASAGKELRLEYQLLLAAYKARSRGQNRQAIVDACSALELCCVDRITDFCNEHSISADILLNKYRSLGDRLNLVGEVDKAFHSKQVKAVVATRNELIHNSNVFPSNEETRMVIRQVESWLQLYFDDFYDKCRTPEESNDQP